MGNAVAVFNVGGEPGWVIAVTCLIFSAFGRVIAKKYVIFSRNRWIFNVLRGLEPAPAGFSFFGGWV